MFRTVNLAYDRIRESDRTLLLQDILLIPNIQSIGTAIEHHVCNVVLVSFDTL